MDLSSEKIFIAGGNCEIALAVAKKAITKGFFPVLGCRNIESLAHVENFLSLETGKFSTALIDFNNKMSIIDFFVNNNDFSVIIDCVHSDIESLIAAGDDFELEKYFKSMVFGRALFVKYASRSLLNAKGGRLIFISSKAAGANNPGQGFYSATKQFAESLYNFTGVELAKKGVSAVSLRFGYIDAGRGARFLKLQNRQDVTISLDKVAEVILFWADSETKIVNSTIINVDGSFLGT